MNTILRLLHSSCIGSEDPISKINSILDDLSRDDALDETRDFMIRFRHSYVDNDTNKSPGHLLNLSDFEKQNGWWRGVE